MIISLLAMLLGLGSLVCWVMVLIKMFKDAEAGGTTKGIIGIICGLYALIWGWQQKEKHGLQKIMMIWLGLIGGNILLQVLARAVA
jgi:hypothetical protein